MKIKGFFLIVLIISLAVITAVKSVLYCDFTTFTEVDNDAFITVYNATSVFVNGTRGDIAYLYDDMDNDYFQEFTHYFDVIITQVDSQNGLLCVWALSDDVDNIKAWRDDNHNFMVVYFQYTSVPDKRIYFGVGNTAGDTFDFFVGFTTTSYYFKVYRDDTNNVCEIYSDSARTALIDTLVVSLSTRDAGSLRYLFATNTYYSGVAVYLKGWVQYLDIGLVEEEEELNLDDISVLLMLGFCSFGFLFLFVITEESKKKRKKNAV